MYGAPMRSSVASYAAVVTALAGVGSVSAQNHADFLPPQLEWDGASTALALAPDHEWATPAERAELAATPRYDETIAWLKKLAAATPDISLLSIGTSAEGREIWMVVASRATSKTPEGLAAAGLPVALVQAGIHSGEIDGKDAGLMLLRDITVLGRRPELLDGASLLFVPILNVDGHERFAGHNRINQRGPVEMGWRSNARNLNLNRDYMKLETEGVRAIAGVINQWRPDLYIDLHVTDGADYQYDVTWATTPDYGWSPHASRWVNDVMAPAVNAQLEKLGHTPGPLVWPVNGRDLSAGNFVWMGTPRFSHVYGAARHLPSILVENHSLKPYRQRVLGTLVFLEATLEVLAEGRETLAQAAREDRAQRADPVVLDFEVGEPPHVETRRLLGVRSETYESSVSGGETVRWTGERVELEVPFVFADKPRVSASRPAAYYIPVAWANIADKLRAHGIEVEELTQAQVLDVEQYRLAEARLAGGGSSFDHRGSAYEGRVRVEPGALVVERHELALRPGSFRVRTDQPLGTLAVLLLEPESPDSFFQWGYFLEILTQPEYAEAYVIEPMARAMLDADSELTEGFQARLAAEPEFAADPQARLDWFYRRTPYYDAEHRLNPIARSTTHRPTP